MMRAAVAAIIAAAAIVQACSRTEEDRDAIFLAALDELGKTLRDARIPVCAMLSERQPLAGRGWAFVQGPPPSGFEDVTDWASVEGPLSLKTLESRLPRRWFIQDGTDRPCFQLTRPATLDRRAVVTGAFAGADEDLLGTWNFWLRREGRLWRVVATTKVHQDI